MRLKRWLIPAQGLLGNLGRKRNIYLRATLKELRRALHSECLETLRPAMQLQTESNYWL